MKRMYLSEHNCVEMVFREYGFRVIRSLIRDITFITALCICIIAVIIAYRNGVRVSFYTYKPFVPLPSENFLAVLEERSPATWREPTKKGEHEAASSSEAIASLRAALEMKIQGKPDKALKLFQHAFVLAPRHPDILTNYGEFLEDTKKDVLTADALYVKALIHSPNHEGALINRQRTASIVESLDREMLKKIDEKRDALAVIPDNNSALRRAKKEAYYQHIYHTVGIEGNTMSLAQTRSILETRTAVSGKSIDEHNEILGLDSAMKYINNSLLNSIRDVTMDDILEVHKRVLGHVDPTEGGHFRRTQVYVGSHIPPGPGLINLLIEQFLSWLNSEDATDLHPVRYAALAHYKFVHIHPFIDGNGRTSRLLMNMLLMQAGYPPVIILKQDRHLYYQHLQTANEGDVRPFVRFIAECTDRTLDLYLWATSEFSHYVPALGEPTVLNEEGSDVENGL